MNVKNNRRRQNTREKIERVFTEMLQTKELSRITVSEICKQTGFNRSTFYANYEDIYALADNLRESLERQVVELYTASGGSMTDDSDWIKLFCHIRDNRIFYKTYFKLGYDSAKIDLSHINPKYIDCTEDQLEYRTEFFRAGLNAIIKKWIANGCKESPEYLNNILRAEYSR